MKTISIYRGDDKDFTLIFKTNGVPIDITGWKIYFTVKRSKDDIDDVAIIKKDWITHSDPTNGKSTFSLTNTETEITPAMYISDFQIKKPDGKIKTLKVLPFEIYTDITRRKT